MGIYTEEQLRSMTKEDFEKMTSEEYHATVYTFYDLCKDMLNHARICADCGERMWIAYCGGHVSDKCRSCPEKNCFSLQSLADGDGFLDLAGYVTSYPVPREPLPDNMEFARYGLIEWRDKTIPPVDGYEKFMYKDKECNPHYTPIEGYYRMKVGRGTVTAVREGPPPKYKWQDSKIYEIDGKIEARGGVTEVKREYVKHDIQVGDVVEYNLCPNPCIARRILRPCVDPA